MARPRVYDERRVTTAIRIPESLHDKLRGAAEERDVSVNLLVVKAIDDYLERLVPAAEVVRAAG
jgi:predicted HicB family RNase H-like nuclease